VKILARLYLLVLPFFGALFITALLRPAVVQLRELGLPRALATWIVLILGFLVLGGLAFFVINRAIAQYPQLVDQLGNAVSRTRDFLSKRPFHISPSQIDNWEKSLTTELTKHKGSVLSGVLTGVTLLGEVVTGLVICFFSTFFLLYDGDRIWGFVLGLFPDRARRGVDEAGSLAWNRLAGFTRGTFLIACFHAIVVAIALLIIGVPLVAPLALLVFVGSFVPIVGAVIFGGFAALVVFLTHGVVPTIVFLGVLVLDNQIEAHLLQPFLVGRFVRLHPLAVILAITAGGIWGGIVGAIIALPITSVTYAIADYYSRGRPVLVTTDVSGRAVGSLPRR
jgi:predicted PurR-regulated permease PerM